MQDWLDIDFGIAEGVDFIAVSFVKSAEVINHLKSYIAARCPGRYVIISFFCQSTSEFGLYITTKFSACVLNFIIISEHSLMFTRPNV